ncbi:hypothetical protein CSKR_101924 [Clonorchis sinensis]|uniref:Uncharacterized protein n=2 Tax=Clonorchis sinensis TaxID=79923 RepID=A0A8T1MH63_CLOSI|nr:hypothetical protein CSKR_101924 [Clonorchis sinensis]GAA48606.1 hypothetical protein CLF_101808 [Clonorchis sinensis]
MDAPITELQPSDNYKSAFSEYFVNNTKCVLSAGAIAGIVVGVIALVLLVILIILLVYCCRVKHPRYQSAYDTEEAQGNKSHTAEHALQQKLTGHPDVKHELYI